ncbi:MAG TPA: RICIN domain-containing protein, partial [Thermoanaerobaculia bacterium]|nr:RICIN domain-containing protein [Thermoanaerobaculia bacterium]
FKLTSQNSKKCLQVRGGSSEEEALVEQGSYGGKPHQQWSLTTWNGAYQIRARHSGKCLTVKEESEARMAPIVQRSWQENDSFLWWLADLFTPT